MILPPFAGELNGFTLLFEAFIIKFCKHMPLHNVCQLMNVSDYKVWTCIFNRPFECVVECYFNGVTHSGFERTKK
jgi:hypothetical protein